MEVLGPGLSMGSFSVLGMSTFHEGFWKPGEGGGVLLELALLRKGVVGLSS